MISYIFILFFQTQNVIDFLIADNYTQAVLAYKNVQISDESLENNFLKTYYNRDATNLIQTYLDLSVNESNKKLQFLALKKCYEYYYALGYYQKAKEFESLYQKSVYFKGDLGIKKELNIKSLKQVSVVLQCGAFGEEANATLLKEKIANLIANKVYLLRDDKLYRVVITDFVDTQSAEQIKKKLFQELQITAMIKTISQ
jgi:hypothetical protein